MENEKKLAADKLLCEMAARFGRNPTRADLSAEELCLIKSVYGPLPRALEAVGLKEPSEQRQQKLKRRRVKRHKSRKRAADGKNAE